MTDVRHLEQPVNGEGEMADVEPDVCLHRVQDRRGPT